MYYLLKLKNLRLKLLHLVSWRPHSNKPDSIHFFQKAGLLEPKAYETMLNNIYFLSIVLNKFLNKNGNLRDKRSLPERVIFLCLMKFIKGSISTYSLMEP